MSHKTRQAARPVVAKGPSVSLTKHDLRPLGKNRYVLPKAGDRRVDVTVYLNDALYAACEGEALQQLADAATLPGAYGQIAGMPDIHVGFGLPIGGVLATDATTGVVSAGAVGMDINCGVRLLSTRLSATAVGRPTLRKIMLAIERRVPVGVGKKSAHGDLRRVDLEGVVGRGARRIVELGFGRPEDLERIEEDGCLPGADLRRVSAAAVGRGDQLSTVGGGNHFIEIQRVDKVYDAVLGAAFGLVEGNLAVMLHTGSRGFGHQICTDYSRIMAEAAAKFGISLPSRGLACAPVVSPTGQDYLAAMACAANFAFANRQLMTHDVREAFVEATGLAESQIGLDLIYDVAHNLAKVEEHFGRRLLVHRKGATRALPPGHLGNPPRYRGSGHPAIVPGSMGTASYVLVGTEATAETFYSVNHGAGRTLSRSAAKRVIGKEGFDQSMGDVLYNARDYRDVVEEAPGAYKNIDDVVDTLAEIGLTRKVARLRPLAVIKGQGDES